MKTPKNSNNSTKKKRSATTVTDFYLDLFTLKEKPVSNAFIEQLAAQLLDWAAHDKEALSIKRFVLSKGIHWNTFIRWSQTREPLKSIYEDAKLLVAARREEGMIKKLYDSKSIMHIQYQFDEDWGAADQRWSDLRKKEQGDAQRGPITVVMSPLGDKTE